MALEVPVSQLLPASDLQTVQPAGDPVMPTAGYPDLPQHPPDAVVPAKVVSSLQPEVDRVLSGQFTPDENMAAELSADPAVWKQRHALTLWMANAVGQPVNRVDALHDDLRKQMFGDQLGADDKQAFEYVNAMHHADLVAKGMIPGTDPLGEMTAGSNSLIFDKSSNWLDRTVSSALVKRDTQTSGLQPPDNLVARNFLGTIIPSAIRMAAYPMGLLPMDKTREFLLRKANETAAEFGPNALERQQMASTHGWSDLANPTWLQVQGGAGAGYIIPFVAGGAGTVSAMQAMGFSSKAMMALGIGTTAGAGIGAIKAGCTLGDLDAMQRDAASALRDIKSGSSPEVLLTKYGPAGVEALNGYRESLLHLSNTNLAEETAWHVFVQNMVVQGALSAVQFGLGAQLVDKALAIKAAPKFSAALASLGLAGGDWYAQQEMMLHQEDIYKRNLALAQAGVANAASLNLMPTETFTALMHPSEHPDEIESIMAGSLLMLKGTAVAALSGYARVNSVAEGLAYRQRITAELQRKAVAGDTYSADALRSMPAERAGVAGLKNWGVWLQDQAKQQAGRVMDLVRRTPADQIGRINPDDLPTPDQQAAHDAHFDAIDEEARAIAAADASPDTAPAGAVPPVLDAAPPSPHVAAISAMVDQLNAAHPDAAPMKVVAVADAPGGGRVNGRAVESYYSPDPVTGKDSLHLVADHVTPEQVLGKWVHEQTERGVEILRRTNPEHADAILEQIQRTITPEAMADMLPRSGLTPEHVGADLGKAMQITAADYLSRVAEKVANGGELNAPQRGHWQKAVDLVHEWARETMRGMGFDLKLNDQELNRLAVDVFRYSAGRPVAPVAAANQASTQDGATVAPQLATPGRSFPQVRMGSPENPMHLAEFVRDNGGIIPRSKVRDPGGEYDGQPSVGELAPFAGQIMSGKMSPDELAQDAYAAGLISAPDSGLLWTQLKGEVKSWRKRNQGAKDEAVLAKQDTAFFGEVLHDGSNPVEMPVDSLRVGDTVEANGEKLKVTEIDPDTGAVTLQDGKRYGVQQVPAGELLHVDRFDPGADAAGLGGDVRFSLNGPDVKRFSLAPEPVDLTSKERTIAAAAAFRIAKDGKVPRETTIAKRLAAVGEATDRAGKVCEVAQRYAKEVRARREQPANDAQLLRALTSQSLRDHYREQVYSAHGAGEQAAVDHERALRQIRAWEVGRVENQADRRRGLSDADWKAAGIDPLERIKQALPEPSKEKAPIEYNPDLVPATEQPPAATPEQQGGAEYIPGPAPDPQTTATPWNPPIGDVPPEKVGAILGLFRSQVEMKLRGEGINITGGSDPVFVAEYARTIRSVMLNAVRDLTFGGRREALVTAINDLENSKTVMGVNNRATAVIQRFNNVRITQDKAQLLQRIDDLMTLKEIARPDTISKDLFRKQGQHPVVKKWLRLVRGVVDLGTADTKAVDSIVGDWLRTGNLENATDNEADAKRAVLEKYLPALKDAAWRDMSIDEVALSVSAATMMYGDLKGRSVPDIAQAHEQLKADIAGGREALEKAQEARKAKLEPMKRDLARAVRPADGKTREHDGVIASAIANEATAYTYTFGQRLRDMVHYAGSKWIEPAKAAEEKITESLALANTREDTFKRVSETDFNAAVKRIYGKSSDGVIAYLQQPQDKYSRYSRLETQGRLSKANLMQILATAEQKQYEANMLADGRTAEYLNEIRGELSSQDMQLLGWLRDWYAKNREELSVKSVEISGVPVVSPDVLYMPASFQRDGDLPVSFTGAVLVPSWMTERVRHNRPVDEKVSVLDLWRSRMVQTAHYLAFVEPSLELRGVFGAPQVQQAVRETFGKKYLADTLGHVVDIINGGYPTAESKLAGKVRNWVTQFALAGNIKSAMSNFAGLPTFAFEVGIADTAKYTATAFTPDGFRAVRELLGSEAGKNRYYFGQNEAVKKALHGDGDAAIEKFYRRLMVSNTIGDGVALVVGQGVYRAFKGQAIARGMNESTAREWAAAMTFDVIEKTQQSGQMKDKALSQRRAGFLGQFAMQFLSSPRQQAGYEVEAFRAWRSGQPGGARKFSEALIINHLVFGGAMYAVGFAFRQLMGRKGNEDELAQLAASILSGPMAGLLLFGSVGETIIKRMLGLKSYQNGGPMDGIFNKLWGSGKNFLHDISNMDLGAAGVDLLHGGAQFVPVARQAEEAVKNRQE